MGDRLVIRLAILFTLAIGVCYGQEPTIDHITAAVAAIETGTTWQSAGRVSGRYARGAAGEISPWQLMPHVLRDIRRSPYRAERDVLYAETAFREWYGHLYARLGSHREALAAYNGGFRGRSRKAPQDYAERAYALAQRLAMEDAK